jgi:hypothetical protein
MDVGEREGWGGVVADGGRGISDNPNNIIH